MNRKASSGKRRRARVSAARAGRLFRLLKLVSAAPVPRAVLLKKLRLGMRTFYRDVDLLRACGVLVDVDGEGYRLLGSLHDALNVLPFPDPELTFGDVEVLLKGRSPTHQKIKQLFQRITK